MRAVRALLWIDSRAGLTVGVLALLLALPLSRLYALPASLIFGMGIVNVAYGTYSFSLERRKVRPRELLVLLVVANAAWAVLSVLAAGVFARHATYFGLAHLLLESAFVGALAFLEWRNLESLRVGAGA